MKKEYELERMCGDWELDRRLFLCAPATAYFFDIPLGQRRIVAVLSDKPTKGNYEIIPAGCGFIYVNGKKMYTYRAFYSELRTHFPKGGYVHIEYMEES